MRLLLIICSVLLFSCGTHENNIVGSGSSSTAPLDIPQGGEVIVDTAYLGFGGVHTVYGDPIRYVTFKASRQVEFNANNGQTVFRCLELTVAQVEFAQLSVRAFGPTVLIIYTRNY